MIVPRRSEVAFQMRIFAQFGVSVSREHFAVCIDVDARPFGLFEEAFEIVEVVPCDDDKRPFFDGK